MIDTFQYVEKNGRASLDALAPSQATSPFRVLLNACGFGMLVFLCLQVSARMKREAGEIMMDEFQRCPRNGDWVKGDC